MRDSLKKATTSEKEKIIEGINILNNRISGIDNRILAIQNERSKLLDLVKEQGRFLIYF